MVTITINKFECKITDCEDINILQKLDRLLSYKIPGAMFMQSYSHWDGTIRLLNKNLTFSYGLLNKVTSFFNSNSIAISVIDNRVKSPAKPKNIIPILEKMGKPPRDYQIEAAAATLYNDCGIIRMATGSGKCSAIDSLHITEYGMLDYSELIDNLKLKPQECIKYESVVATPITKNKTDKSSMLYYDGYGKSRKIITKYGYEITATQEHKIKILDKSGEIIWKKIEDLNIGDYAVIVPGTQMFGQDNMSLDDAYWYGLLAGDGCLTQKSYVGFTNMDEHILNFVRKYLKKEKICKCEYMGTNKNGVKNKATDIRIYDTKYRARLYDLGFDYSKSIHKKIPTSIRRLSKKPLSMFIRGLYETDGWVEKDGSICIGLSNKKLIDQIHLILLNFGVVASRRVKKTTHEDCHILTIYADFVSKFMSEIGFDTCGHKYARVQDVISKKIKSNTNNYTVPNQNKKIERLVHLVKKIIGVTEFKKCPVSYLTIKSWKGNGFWRSPSNKNLHSFINWIKSQIINNNCDMINECVDIVNNIEEMCSQKYYFDPIKIIEETQSDNYDFVIPESHSFVSQGFINHNTVVSALIIANFCKSTILFVIGKDLLYQTYELYKEIFGEEKVGIVGDGLCDIKKYNVVSVWTAGAALGLKKNQIAEDLDQDESDIDKDKYEDIRKMLIRAKTIIVDECHVSSSITLQTIGKNIDADHLIGMSASPWRDDGQDLLIESLLGRRIIEMSASKLIREGWLAQPIIKFIDVPKYHEKLPKQYQTVYKKYIIENEIRNNLIVENVVKLVGLGYKPLVLFDKIAHGDILYDMLSEKFPCGLLSGKDSAKNRDKVKEQIISGEIKCLIASRIFDIGIDIPCLNALVLCGSGKSSVRALQRIGRVIRKFQGKKHAAIVDFLDNAHYVKDHSKARRKIYETEEGFIIKWPEKQTK